MIKSSIIILLYDDNIIVKKDLKTDVIPVDTNITKNGRLNNVDSFIKILKKSKIISKSSYKLFNDKYIIIYFGDYNDYELSTLKSKLIEEGFSKITLIDYITLLDSNSTYIFYNHDKYYIYGNHKKYVLNKECLSLNEMITNSKIIADKNAYEYISNKYQNTFMYVVDNLVNYLLNKIC